MKQQKYVSCKSRTLSNRKLLICEICIFPMEEVLNIFHKCRWNGHQPRWERTLNTSSLLKVCPQGSFHTLPYFLRWQTRGKLGGGGGKRGCMPFLCCCTCVSWRSGTRCGTQQSFHLTFLQTSFSIILARTVFKLHSRKPVSFLVPTEEDWCFSTKRGFGCGGI